MFLTLNLSGAFLQLFYRYILSGIFIYICVLGSLKLVCCANCTYHYILSLINVKS